LDALSFRQSNSRRG